MKAFLQQVAHAFLSAYGTDVSRLTFVFPNRRAGVFFCKYLGQESDVPLLSPRILTINNLFEELSGLKLDDRIDLLFRLYDIFVRVSGSNESFDDFYYWGEMLLNDFDDVDKYMADAAQLFSNVRDLKQIDEEFAHLTPEQLAAVRQFWDHFIPADKSAHKQSFARTWEVLYRIYDELRCSLRTDGLAYEGMMFRDVAEQLSQSDALPDQGYEKIVFVGLNALTTAERTLMLKLRDKGLADFYWDYQAPPLRDPDNRASRFVVENERDFPSAIALPPFPADYRPEVEVVGVPSAVGQTKYAYKLLEELLEQGEIASPERALDTAIILPDENLLMPTLYSIPQPISSINVTMGYSLKNTPVSGLMQYLFDLQRTMRVGNNGKAEFYHRCVTDILNHRYVAAFAPESAPQLTREIKQRNRLFISEDDFADNPLLKLIFTPITQVDSASDYLLNVLQCLQQGLAGSPAEAPDTAASEEEDAASVAAITASELEREFIYHYYITVLRLADVTRAHHTPFSLTTYFRLLGRMTEGLTIPFRGEPLSGLQVMGVLETRALDFDHQIILSMNEGVFPLKKAANTFIPYNLRRGFGLSTNEHQDAVYAYHFYRLIMRAKRVTLLYDTREDGMQTGEVSRFIYQLKYHYRFPIVERAVTYDITIPQARTVTVEKTPEVMQQLSRYLADYTSADGRRPALSASTINSYLKCPLKFYFTAVEGLREEDEVSETLEMRVFGNIFHAVMEAIYKRCRGKRVDADYIKAVMQDEAKLKELIRREFIANYLSDASADEQLDGYNLLASEVLWRYTMRVLEEDLKLTPFVFLGAEEHYNMDYPIRDGRRVRLMGKIDRLDHPLTPTPRIRIVDYKTGSIELGFHDMGELFDANLAEKKFAPIMQVLFYAMLYLQRPAADPDLPVEPHLYSLRNLFLPTFKSIPEVRERRGTATSADATGVSQLSLGPVSNFARIETDFRQCLTACLNEIFDASVPFVQTEEVKNCQYCHLREVCRR